MKTIIILAAIAFAHGAKLERTYLPPTHAGTSGGSGNFLETPFSGPKSTEAIFKSNFGQSAQAETTHAQAGSQHAQFGAENARFGGEYAQNGNGFGQAGNGFAQQQYNEVRPERAQAALERNAAILRSDNSNDGETYAYAYETENGIYAEESGVATNGVEAQGGYSYTGDDGQVYSVRYTADQNGFVPQGDHLPTPPPIPEEILKALEQNARDEAAGIYDDGSYNEAKYSGSQNQGYEYEQGKNQYEQNQYEQTQNQYEQTQNQYEQNQNGNSFATDDAVVTNSALTRSSSRTFNTPARSDLGSSHSGIPARNSPQNAYLPPFAQPAQNAFGRRQSFDSRNGYRY